MVIRDSYDELEVSPRASREVIDAAYRRLARKHHPDSGEDPNSSRMVRLNLAYQAIIEEHETGRRSELFEPSVDELLTDAHHAAEEGNWPETVRIVEQILSRAPENLDALLLKTEAGVEQERWGDAARSARQALRLHPDHIDALLFAAESACGTQEYLLARAFAATVLQFNPNDRHAREIWQDAQYYLTRRI